MHDDAVVICSAARTPIGAFQGMFSHLSATELGAIAARAAVNRAGVDPARIERLYMGCVLPAGLGQAPARQVALKAGLPLTVQATTINKMCGSGMQAVIMATEAIRAGAADVILAGGMESMSNAPYLLPKHRNGARIGHDRIVDSMMMDGLEDAYEPGKAMGVFAEDAARRYGFSRQAQDEYALRSLARARDAIASGAFDEEIVAVPGRASGPALAVDEQPGRAKPEKIPTLRPAFEADGTITAANASSISDGAAALLLARESVARRMELPVLAHIAGCAAHAQQPAAFTSAPVPAIRSVLSHSRWSLFDVDLFEVNEAFAVVAMIAAQSLDISPDQLNVHGGATALGHPIGASGARILVTLLAALRQRELRRGVAALCIGGGEATAVAIERG